MRSYGIVVLGCFILGLVASAWGQATVPEVPQYHGTYNGEAFALSGLDATIDEQFTGLVIRSFREDGFLDWIVEAEQARLHGSLLYMEGVIFTTFGERNNLSARMVGCRGTLDILTRDTVVTGPTIRR